jgi:hypothetical protein
MTDHEYADDFTALAELAEAFTMLVAAMHGGDPAVLTADRVVAMARPCMPRAQHAALIIRDGDRVDTAAHTHPITRTIDSIRADTGEGPGLDALETNDIVISGDLESDPRWPKYGAKVTAETSIRSIAAYRLYLSSRHRAALMFYSDWPDAFDDLAIATGAIFAAYCSLTVTNNLLFEEPIRPRRAADVHREIGVAIGILMTTNNHTTDSAAAHLHRASRQLAQTLPDIARHVINHRGLPPAASADDRRR